MVIAHKTHNPIDSSVKFVTFIDAMLSLVVTQDVLLESQGTAHAAQSRFSIVKSHTRTRQIADRVQRLTQEMSVYHRTGGLLCFIGLWMLLRRRWTVLASGEDSPDDAVPAVEITAETEA